MHHIIQRPDQEVLKEEDADCTMLFVDGGFSIDIIFDLSLWRWEEKQEKRMEEPEKNKKGGEKEEREE